MFQIYLSNLTCALYTTDEAKRAMIKELFASEVGDEGEAAAYSHHNYAPSTRLLNRSPPVELKKARVLPRFSASYVERIPACEVYIDGSGRGRRQGLREARGGASISKHFQTFSIHSVAFVALE